LFLLQVKLMHECWHVRPQARPSFTKIMETLEVCIKECCGGKDDWEEHIVFPDRKQGAGTGMAWPHCLNVFFCN
jgi:hypothetical protein